MSRSRKKHPAGGWTTAISDKQDKRLSARAWRRRVHVALSKGRGCFLFRSLLGFCLLPSSRAPVLLVLPAVSVEFVRINKPVPAVRYSTEAASLDLLADSLGADAEHFSRLNRGQHVVKISSLKKVPIIFFLDMRRSPAKRVIG